ncbi:MULTISPECIES: c-type cytochrome [unclassified Pseudomonas]|uniref:c-type cytochrome n=1 Tax=unclassified Pseudomonas TaxID=196821 RepID=UPI001F3D61CD|nr:MULTISPECIES: cytochrome c [unclassified Pseudomonas]MCF5228459.1 c-type cytochrome [Pseudomonas sp. PA-5-4H]MCF5235404.1 c-type cytochrome [Pseudomonas sp. PA-5-4G]MCF5250937.1 c-type cytochrome [Pseudomonas sp. PA-5-4B]MCF5255595.1 c-type cytochrome [Pseudomonas sp. PA-5-4B]MCF5262389.1 c-type cytochrome [Pseudomonas sp. PA-5-4A]
MAVHNLTAMALGLLSMGVVACASTAAQSGLGQPVTEHYIARWNIDVAPDGKSLPAGQGTVMEGEKVYQTSCLGCHGAHLEGGTGPALVGGAGSLPTPKPVKTVGSYWPYATTLFDYVRRTMPFQQPQSLSNDQVYAVVGYILNKNEIVEANATVDAATLTHLKMPNRDGFYVDDRPDVRVEPCYKDCIGSPKAR